MQSDILSGILIYHYSYSTTEAVIAGAAWRIDGGDWHDSDDTVFNIAVGTRTVSFKDITGWTTPANKTVTIENEKTATVTATYTAVEKVSVLTPSSPNATVSTGESAKIFGSSTASSITIEAGAVAKLINFPGSNTITIKSDSNKFTVSRSGSTVTFEGTDGTYLKMPATKTAQTIIFNDVSAKLVIENNKVMFGTQTVTLSAEGITGAEQTPYTKLDENGNDLPVTAASWSMVRDNTTGLIWENKNSKDGVKNYANPNDADNTYTWYDSNPATNGGHAGFAGNGTDTEDFIKALNDADFGGYSDWRMPTIYELLSIVDFSSSSPVVPMDIPCWSSSTSINNSNALVVDFRYSTTSGSNANKSSYGYVRAVRSGQ